MKSCEICIFKNIRVLTFSVFLVSIYLFFFFTNVFPVFYLYFVSVDVIIRKTPLNPVMKKNHHPLRISVWFHTKVAIFSSGITS